MPPKQAPKGGKKEPSKKPMKPKEGGGKAKKKKWSKGKVRDKLANMVLFDNATFEKLLKEVPQYKVITPSVVSERLKIRASLARHALEELWRRGMRLNQETVLETPRLFMVPYLRVHVPKYHSWMQDSWLRETTSSEQLTLDEVLKQLYQDYWSLNNIKVELDESQLNIHENAEIYSMIGDINLFITYSHTINDFEGELSVMIAESKYRGQGLAAEALAGILEYSGRNLPMKLNSIVAKVSMTNQSSINFFQNRLKFIERSRNNVFNEIEFVPEIQQLPSEDQNQSEYKNLALNTSQLIIDRLLTNSLGSTSKWYYLENDLKLWRQTPRE
ncbi:hypothetical protein Smp_017450 [Schistosoma mansoni]|uniref:hypothetical protein n=1 Tax=Schistosoma mansoni TaxID=6183 RepID=UPI00019B34EA|nr:hypothetical protein Smp_017450 [Schistosoma mansoni]|eukprot:XP_018645514.1 hypothetical protein Smp_017450 [Schistosoma mansoni]